MLPRIEEVTDGILKEPRKARERIDEFLANRDEPDEGAGFGRRLEQELKTRPAVITEMNNRIHRHFRDVLAFDGPLAQWPTQRLDPARVSDDAVRRC